MHVRLGIRNIQTAIRWWRVAKQRPRGSSVPFCSLEYGVVTYNCCSKIPQMPDFSVGTTDVSHVSPEASQSRHSEEGWCIPLPESRR